MAIWRFHATSYEKHDWPKNELQFSPKGLTERFLKDSFHVTKYSSYLKTVMAGSDQYKSKTAISGLPCRVESWERHRDGVLKINKNGK